MLGAIVVAIVAFRTLPIGDWLAALESWARLHPVSGAAVYVLVTAIALVAMVPGWIPMMLAGYTFGTWPGLLFGLLGIVAGSTAAFYSGRTLARRWTAKRIAGNPRLVALDEALGDQAFVIVFLTRVAFVLPFNLLNYAYGATRVRTATYVLATAAGMLPIVGIYVYLGSLSRDLGQILQGDVAVGAWTWWAVGVAVMAILAVVLVIRRAVGRALDARMRESAGT